MYRAGRCRFSLLEKQCATTYKAALKKLQLILFEAKVNINQTTRALYTSSAAVCAAWAVGMLIKL